MRQKIQFYLFFHFKFSNDSVGLLPKWITLERNNFENFHFEQFFSKWHETEQFIVGAIRYHIKKSKFSSRPHSIKVIRQKNLIEEKGANIFLKTNVFGSQLSEFRDQWTKTRFEIKSGEIEFETKQQVACILNFELWNWLFSRPYNSQIDHKMWWCIFLGKFFFCNSYAKMFSISIYVFW